MSNSDMLLNLRIDMLIDSVLSEAIVNLGDDKYKLSPEQINSLKSWISGDESKPGLGVTPYNAEENFLSWLSGLPEPLASQVSEKVESAVPKAFQSTVKEILSDIDNFNPQVLFSQSVPASDTGTSEVSVPPELLPLADFKTPGSAGTQIGRGELVIPFLFDNAMVDPAANAPYDVIIDGVGWHVKEGSPSGGIRMGQAKDKTIAATEIYTRLVRAGANPGDLGELNQKIFKARLPEWAGLLDMSPEELYDEISTQASAAALGDAGGILWYRGGLLTFTPRNALQLDSTTQGRAKLSIAGRRKILGESFLNEDLLDIRTELLLEELTRSDKKDIDKMIKKALKVERTDQMTAFKKEIAKELNSSSTRKRIKELVESELKTSMKSKDTKTAVADVTKLVLRKLYRELAYNYTPVIDRIKI